MKQTGICSHTFYGSSNRYEGKVEQIIQENNPFSMRTHNLFYTPFGEYTQEEYEQYCKDMGIDLDDISQTIQELKFEESEKQGRILHKNK